MQPASLCVTLVNNGNSANANTRVSLAENSQVKREAITGNRPENKTQQAAIEESMSPDIGTILYLAGINKEVKEN